MPTMTPARPPLQGGARTFYFYAAPSTFLPSFPVAHSPPITTKTHLEESNGPVRSCS